MPDDRALRRQIIERLAERAWSDAMLAYVCGFKEIGHDLIDQYIGFRASLNRMAYDDVLEQFAW